MMVVAHTTIVTYPRSHVQWVGPFHYVPSCGSYDTIWPPTLVVMAPGAAARRCAGHAGRVRV